MTHRNARLTPVTRAELVEQVLSGWPQAEVPRLFRVSRATVASGCGGSVKVDWMGIARSTVYAVLRRAGLHRLAWLHRTTREVVRYEHARPGDLVHLDIKKLGRIPQGGGKRILPGFGETHSGPQRGPRLGFDFLHVAVDDHSRYPTSRPCPTNAARPLPPSLFERLPTSRPRHRRRAHPD